MSRFMTIKAEENSRQHLKNREKTVLCQKLKETTAYPFVKSETYTEMV